MSEPARLPYPHSCNDCEMCRERDADCQVRRVGESEDEPMGRHGPLRVCRRCLGEHAIMRLHYDGPFMVMPLDLDNRVYQSDLGRATRP